MNEEHIRQAIRVMEEVRDGNKPFDMSDWFTPYSDPIDCGTAACLLGWMARDSYFQALGVSSFTNRTGGVLYPIRAGVFGSAIIADLFDIGGGKAASVVYIDGYYPSPGAEITPDMVIRKLEDLLKGD